MTGEQNGRRENRQGWRDGIEPPTFQEKWPNQVNDALGAGIPDQLHDTATRLEFEISEHFSNAHIPTVVTRFSTALALMRCGLPRRWVGFLFHCTQLHGATPPT